jgi:hypothetical protein
MCIPTIIARQCFGKHVPAATNTHNRRTAGRIVFFTVRVVSKESLWVRMCAPNFGPATAEVTKTWIYTSTPPHALMDRGNFTFTAEAQVSRHPDQSESKIRDWNVYPPTVARQRLGQHVPVATKNCWKHRFVCDPYRIKEKQAISYYQKLFLLIICMSV